MLDATGPEVIKSAAGRLHGEMVWLPCALLQNARDFAEPDTAHCEFSLASHSVDTRVTLAVDSVGALRSMCFSRWGTPDDGVFQKQEFGGLVEDERSFGGLCIPSKLRIGWYPTSERFKQGEFFQVEIDDAQYR
jgi:hypothetical protein